MPRHHDRALNLPHFLTMAETWRAGHRLLEARIRALPDVLLRCDDETPRPSRIAPERVRGFVITGVGSSAAHARYLAHLLDVYCGLRARCVPLSALVEERRPADDSRNEVLVVVSQGLSPNARLALADRHAWGGVVLMTAQTEAGARRAGEEEKARLLAELGAAGVEVIRFAAGEDEYGTLVRVTGPMVGYLAALGFARTLAAALGRHVPSLACASDVVAAAVASAAERVDALLAETGPIVPLALLTSGTYAECVDNLRFKVMEGMLLPPPPVWDLLHVAHGPFQQAHAQASQRGTDRGRGSAALPTWVALTRADAAGNEGPLFDRVATMLEAAEHRLVRLRATLPGPYAILEHEALVNEIMLRHIASAAIDQVRWPGRGHEAPLYDLGSTPAIATDTRPPPGTPDPSCERDRDAERLLAVMTWKDLEAALARGARSAVLGLGSTEQHGPHLPFATDTWIADALARRFCARVPEAIALPTFALGCSSEHMAFPGTLDLRRETLGAVLVDLAASLEHHGFTCFFIFSAHGGNYAALAAALPALRAAATRMQVVAFTDAQALTVLFHRESAAAGVGAPESGHHAGEFETSIMRGLHPDLVRLDRLAPGYVATERNPAELFYPSVRRFAPTGTVGDPRAAEPARAGRYLDVWTDALVAAYRREKKSTKTNGT